MDEISNEQFDQMLLDRAPQTQYPWDEWTAPGQPREFAPGRDYHVKTRSFLSQYRRAAWARGMRCEVGRIPGGAVIIRTHPIEIEQI